MRFTAVAVTHMPLSPGGGGGFGRSKPQSRSQAQQKGVFGRMANYVRYSDLREGDIIHSPHEYRVLVTTVNDPAKETKLPDRHVEIKGHIHADTNREIVTERHEAFLSVRLDDLDISFDDNEF